MNSRTRPYHQALKEALSDPEEAAHYLNVALEDSPEMFRKACLNVIQARQVASVAKKAGVTRENLYRSFSAKGNPTLETLHAVLSALGLRLGVQAQPGFSGEKNKSVRKKWAHKQIAPPRKAMAQS